MKANTLFPRIKVIASLSDLRYNVHMDNQYKRSATTVSLLNYHFAFCPRYRRKIFLVDGMEDFFKSTVSQICGGNHIDILAMECHIDHCHIFVSMPPTISPSKFMQMLKANTSHALQEKFPEVFGCNRIWTRSYFASTAGNVSSATIQQYVETQKTR